MKIRAMFASIMSALFLISFSAAYSQQGDQAEMMKKWQDYMTPSTVHQAFAKMAGNWNASVTTIMGGQEMKSEGSGVYEVILGGRYLKSSFKSTMMGMPFEGFGLDGYDNATKQYLSVWMDNFGTGIMYLKGKMDDATKTVVYTGMIVDPMSGNEVPTKTTMKMIDDDHSVMEMFSFENGKEVKNMQIDYTRVKQ